MVGEAGVGHEYVHDSAHQFEFDEAGHEGLVVVCQMRQEQVDVVGVGVYVAHEDAPIYPDDLVAYVQFLDVGGEKPQGVVLELDVVVHLQAYYDLEGPGVSVAQLELVAV